MNKPSSRYLSYQCSLFKGVSFHEFCVIASCGSAFSLVVSVVLGWVLGYLALTAFIGFVTGGVLSIFWIPRQFAKRKKGKPHGYLVKSIRLKLARWHLIDSPYTFYQGAWRKAKRFRG